LKDLQEALKRPLKVFAWEGKVQNKLSKCVYDTFQSPLIDHSETCKRFLGLQQAFQRHLKSIGRHAAVHEEAVEGPKLKRNLQGSEQALQKTSKPSNKLQDKRKKPLNNFLGCIQECLVIWL
jgi:hypothetical protein